MAVGFADKSMEPNIYVYTYPILTTHRAKLKGWQLTLVTNVNKLKQINFKKKAQIVVVTTLVNKIFLKISCAL